MVALLKERGEPGGIRIVGGAAISLRYYERGPTKDIDASVHPSGPALEVARAVAYENRWADDWFNSAATMFVPFAKTEWVLIFEDGDVGIWVASAPMLLAMKLRASRPGRDDRDIGTLMTICGVRSKYEAEDLYEEFYPGEILEPKAHRILDVILRTGLPDLPSTPAPPDLG